eukprot:TRINITY_DN15056_c1_g1_i1.p1 TRINITY_DN15056_c1_g1~~TRINITY_DN15056_c1_g1_i1.p1  ORF type:complete len:192 (-),score=-24.87 TRINITY_DN15056_c1_g1_i1:730-1305(-)
MKHQSLSRTTSLKYLVNTLFFSLKLCKKLFSFHTPPIPYPKNVIFNRKKYGKQQKLIPEIKTTSLSKTTYINTPHTQPHSHNFIVGKSMHEYYSQCMHTAKLCNQYQFICNQQVTLCISCNQDCLNQSFNYSKYQFQPNTYLILQCLLNIPQNVFSTNNYLTEITSVLFGQHQNKLIYNQFIQKNQLQVLI